LCGEVVCFFQSTTTSAHLKTMMTTPPPSSKYRDDHSTLPDPPEDDDHDGSHFSGYDSPHEYEMGDIRNFNNNNDLSPDRGAVSPPSSIWGHKYSDTHSDSLRGKSLEPYDPPFDVDDQMHREFQGAPLTRQTSPLFKCLIGVAMLCMIVVGSVFVKNKNSIEEMSPSLNEQFNSENTVIEGIPSDFIHEPPTSNSNGSSSDEEGSDNGDSNNSSASQQSVDSGNEQQQSSVQSSAATEGSTVVEQIISSSENPQDVKVDSAAADAAAAAVEPVESNNDITTTATATVATTTTATVTTATTPYVPKNEAGEVDLGEWCGGCAAGPPGVNCDGRVSYLGRKYGTPELEAKIYLMEQGRCHESTAAEIEAKRPVYPCRKSPEDQGGEEGAESFCGYCQWRYSQFDCWTRLDYVMNTYHVTESKAKQDLITINECVLPGNYTEQFNKDKEDGVEEWCGHCSWGPHKCAYKLDMYTSGGEKTEVVEKKEILDAGECKKQPLCDAKST
jgi:hypothetical protein